MQELVLYVNHIQVLYLIIAAGGTDKTFYGRITFYVSRKP